MVALAGLVVVIVGGLFRLNRGPRKLAVLMGLAAAFVLQDQIVAAYPGAFAVLMPDTPANQEQYPQPSSQQSGLGFPIARLVGVVSLSSGAVVDYALGAYQGKRTGEMQTNLSLPAEPVFDGVIAAGGRLYVCREDGTVMCLGD